MAPFLASTVFARLLQPQLNQPVTIQLQKCDRCTAFGCLSNDVTRFHSEVGIPVVDPRVKQAHQCTGQRIIGALVCALQRVAVSAGEAKIVPCTSAAVLPCPNMLNMESQERNLFLPHSAILAAAVGSCEYVSTRL